MIFGKDISYSYFGDLSLHGEVFLTYSDIVVTHNEVTEEDETPEYAYTYINHSYFGGCNIGNNIPKAQYMFANCYNIEKISSYVWDADINESYITYEIGTWTEVVNNIDYTYTYYYTYTYNDVNIRRFVPTDESGIITNMEGMFENCYNMTEANLAYFNISKCESFDKMFNGCTYLENVIFGHYKLPDTATAEHIFDNCKNLKTVYFLYDLQDDYKNIIGAAGDRTRFYTPKYVGKFNPRVSYYTLAYHENFRYTTFTLNEIGAFIIENQSVTWDNLAILIGHDNVFTYHIGDERPIIQSTDNAKQHSNDVICSDSLINGYTTQKVTYNENNEYAVELRVDTFNGNILTYSFSTQISYNYDDRDVSIDIPLIYLAYDTEHGEPCNYTYIFEHRYSYVHDDHGYTETTYIDAYREETNQIRRIEDLTYYEYPDYKRYKVINARTGKWDGEYEYVPNIDKSKNVSYVNADVVEYYGKDIRSGVGLFGYAALGEEIK